MASVATLPQPSQGQIQGQSQGQIQGQSQETQDDPLNKFRALGQQVKQLQDQFPEFSENAIAILREIQKGMTKVAGNPQRTQEKQAPPIA
jgi:hypothetical protein